MPATRYECPRCQTMFVKDTGGEAAFVECPSCGALALPAGDATEDSLGRALSGPQPVHVPLNAPTDGHDVGRDFQHNVPNNLSTEAEMAPVADPSVPPSMPSSPAFVPGAGPGVFSGLLDNAPSEPRASAPPGNVDFDFGKDVDLDFDKHMPSSPAVSSLPRTFTPKAGAPENLPRTFTPKAGAPPAPSSSGRGNVHSRPDGIQFNETEATDGGVGKTAPWTGLSDEAFGDLEKAFDEMALRPGAAAPARGRGGLSADEEEFLRGDRPERDKKPPQLPHVGDDGPTGRREGPPKPPPRRGTKPSKQRPPDLALSDEARRLAFLPLRAEPRPSGAPDTSGPVARPKLGSVGPKLALGKEAHGHAVETGAEATDLVREPRKEKTAPPRTVPSAFRGLTIGRAIALVLLAALIGGGAGFGLTPKPQRPNTPRARAELDFAAGNRFYDEGRFDDALGKFKGAIGKDGTFAPAYRAKGAALAKLQRFDEAADAYKKYLELEPSAVDSGDVNDAIKRRETPKAP